METPASPLLAEIAEVLGLPVGSPHFYLLPCGASPSGLPPPFRAALGQAQSACPTKRQEATPLTPRAEYPVASAEADDTSLPSPLQQRSPH
jgi:hypothetical protein